MKIVILDKCTVTKGDVDLSLLERCGEVVYYDILTKSQIIEALQGADAVVCNKAVIDREIMDNTCLRFIGLFATGYYVDGPQIFDRYQIADGEGNTVAPAD